MKIVRMSIFNNYCKLNLELKQLTGCYLTVKTTEKHKRDLIGTIHVLKHYQKCYRQLKIIKRTLSNRLATERQFAGWSSKLSVICVSKPHWLTFVADLRKADKMHISWLPRSVYGAVIYSVIHQRIIS